MVIHSRQRTCRGWSKLVLVHTHLTHRLLQLRELYELLSANYVEDDDETFRIFCHGALPRYCSVLVRLIPYPRRALKPPDYFKEWHVGVRVTSSLKLVAFISAIPIRVCVRDR